MLNPRKIQLMTRLAVLEKEHGRELQKIRESFRSDYIGIPMLKNALRITAVFLLVLGAAAVGNVEFLLEAAAQKELALLGVGVLAAYLVLLLVTLIVTFLYRSAEYERNRFRAKEYEELLKKLAALEEE